MSIEIDFEMDVDFVPSTNARCKVCNDGLEGWEMAAGLCILCYNLQQGMFFLILGFLIVVRLFLVFLGFLGFLILVILILLVVIAGVAVGGFHLLSVLS